MSNRTALLGKKLGMSQVWDENGFFVPVTLVDVSTNVVTAVKSEESDGYKAVQLGSPCPWWYRSRRPGCLPGTAQRSAPDPARTLRRYRCAPSRILKGKRMAGRMGHVTNTALNLTIVSSDVENGVLAIKGAIPGPKGSIVLVRSAVKGA